MKIKILVRLLALTLVVSPQPSALLHASPLVTAFTYQCHLNDVPNPATGSFDLKFTLFDTGNGGVFIAGPITNSPVAVSNGLFTVSLDFGGGVFTGTERWLEIGVRSNGVRDFTSLGPHQLLTTLRQLRVQLLIACALAVDGPGEGGVAAGPVVGGVGQDTPRPFSWF